jgi:methyl-accepting chemotaxis protein
LLYVLIIYRDFSILIYQISNILKFKENMGVLRLVLLFMGVVYGCCFSFGDITGAISNAASSAVSTVTDTTSSAINTASSAVDTTANAVSDFTNTINNLVSSATQTVSSAASSAV